MPANYETSMGDRDADDEDQPADKTGSRADPRVLFAALLARIREARESSEEGKPGNSR